jgi:hypothetical protein
MKYSDKQIKTEEAGASEKGEQSFTFPHGPQPVVIKAKNIVEATKKFEELTKPEKSSEKIINKTNEE